MKNETEMRRLVVLKMALASRVSVGVLNSLSMPTSLYQTALCQRLMALSHLLMEHSDTHVGHELNPRTASQARRAFREFILCQWYWVPMKTRRPGGGLCLVLCSACASRGPPLWPEVVRNWIKSVGRTSEHISGFRTSAHFKRKIHATQA